MRMYRVLFVNCLLESYAGFATILRSQKSSTEKFFTSQFLMKNDVY